MTLDNLADHITVVTITLKSLAIPQKSIVEPLLVVPLLALPPKSMAETIGQEGARAVFRSLRRGCDPFQDPDLPRRTKQRLESACSTPSLTIRSRECQGDAEKLLFQLKDGRQVDAVLLDTNSRRTLCLSTQVGCKRGCVFCRTGRMGLVRNLTCEEIVGQVVLTKRPVRNLVFMGMGEPLDNLVAVREALEILTDNSGLGFAKRHVTLSTIGTSPAKITSLRDLPAQIAWSLHTADEEERRLLIPGSHQRLDDLLNAFQQLSAARKRALFVAITLIRGVNDSVTNARKIARCFGRFDTEVRFNLLLHNDEEPDWEAAQRFQASLRQAGYFCMFRKKRGGSNNAACGQLANSEAEDDRYLS